MARHYDAERNHDVTQHSTQDYFSRLDCFEDCGRVFLKFSTSLETSQFGKWLLQINKKQGPRTKILLVFVGSRDDLVSAKGKIFNPNPARNVLQRLRNSKKLRGLSSCVMITTRNLFTLVYNLILHVSSVWKLFSVFCLVSRVRCHSMFVLLI